MLTRRTRQRSSIAAPSRGRLSVHRQTVPSSLASTRTLHPEKSTVSASRDLRPQPQHRQYFRIVLEPIPIRSDTVSTTSYESIRAFDYATIRLHAHTVLLHSTYNIVLEYDSITSTSRSRPRMSHRIRSHHRFPHISLGDTRRSGYCFTYLFRPHLFYLHAIQYCLSR